MENKKQQTIRATTKSQNVRNKPIDGATIQIDKNALSQAKKSSVKINSKKRIYLIVADKSEIESITESGFINTGHKDTTFTRYYFLENNEYQIILAWSKIGLVNAAMTMQDFINNFHPKIIYNFGSVGSNNKIDLFKTFIVTEAFYGDVETPWYPLGQLPNEPRSFKLFSNFKSALPRVKIASSNSFVWHYEKAMYLSQLLGTNLFDMETVSFAQVARANRIAFAAFKCVSDIADGKQKAKDEINRNIKIAGDNAFKIMIENII